jgi:uncharacterized protein (TIGR00730 family)
MRICVFCGSKKGHGSKWLQASEALGRELARRQVGLVYGGGAIGLMGVIADAALAAGGEVIGVIPESLVLPEVAHAGLTRLEVVQTMHQRKARMAELSDAFLAMPGGFGTLDELFEITTWAQLRLHHKPIGLCNLNGFFGPLLAWLELAEAEGFLHSQHRALLKIDDDPLRLLASLLPDASVQ